jgi:hypothetical protein
VRLFQSVSGRSELTFSPRRWPQKARRGEEAGRTQRHFFFRDVALRRELDAVIVLPQTDTTWSCLGNSDIGTEPVGWRTCAGESVLCSVFLF